MNEIERKSKDLNAWGVLVDYVKVKVHFSLQSNNTLFDPKDQDFLLFLTTITNEAIPMIITTTTADATRSFLI